MALTGTQLGDRSRMAYWVDRTRYPRPLDETCADGDLITSTVAEGASVFARAQGMDSETFAAKEVSRPTSNPAQQAFLLRIAERMKAGSAAPRRGISAQDLREKVLPLPYSLSPLDNPSSHAGLPERRQRFLLRRGAPRCHGAIADRPPGRWRRSVHRHRPQPRIDDRLRCAAASGSRQFEIPLFITIGSPLGLRRCRRAAAMDREGSCLSHRASGVG